MKGKSIKRFVSSDGRVNSIAVFEILNYCCQDRNDEETATSLRGMVEGPM